MAQCEEAHAASERRVFSVGRLVTAEALAIATGLGYLLAFIYQTGLVSYYGVPLETVRVSPEWVMAIALLLLPSAFLLVGSVTVMDWLMMRKGSSRPAPWTYVVLGVTAICLSVAFRTSVWTTVLVLVGILLTSIGLAAFVRRTAPTQASRPILLTSLMALLAFILIALVTFLGYSSARGQTTYLVDSASARVLVYSADSLLVFSDYDPKSGVLEPTITYVNTAALGAQGLSLARVETGRLSRASDR